MALRRDVGNQLHLQQEDVILQLQLALLQATQLQIFRTRIAHEHVDHAVEVAVFDFELDDTALDIFAMRAGHGGWRNALPGKWLIV
jgi:hypothetical protein